MDDPESLSVEQEGRLHVRGVRELLARDERRDIHFDVVALKLHRNFSAYSSGTRFSGKVLLSRDTIGIAGQERTTTELLFSCFPSSNQEWVIMFGFLPADLGVRQPDDIWYCQCYLPEAVFAELATNYKSGQADALNMTCTADFWAPCELLNDWYYDEIESIYWKLAPKEHGAQGAKGKITGLSWEIGPAKPFGTPAGEGRRLKKIGG